MGDGRANAVMGSIRKTKAALGIVRWMGFETEKVAIKTDISQYVPSQCFL